MLSLRRLRSFAPLWLAILLCGFHPMPSPAADRPGQRWGALEPATNEFDAVTASVVALLQTHDAARFAGELAVSADDWKALASTNLPAAAESLEGFASAAPQQRAELEASAKQFLSRADSLRLDFSRGDLHPVAIAPKYLGNASYPTLQAKGEFALHAQKLDILLHPDSDTNRDGGDFKVTLFRLQKYPAGWRCMGGIQWSAFPTNLLDEKSFREIAILQKAAGFTELTGKDDPALLQLGDTLAQLLRRRDTDSYRKNALINSDLIWAQLEKSGRKGPSREQINQYADQHVKEQIEIAQKMLDQMKDAGIDLKDADIGVKEAYVARLQSAGGPVSLDGLRADGFKAKLDVKTAAKSRTGASLAGEYVVGAGAIQRYGDTWRVENGVRLDSVPAGVLDAKATAAIKFENYVAEHGSLPPKSAAPEIEFTTLSGDKKMKLSDLRGKVVVLDFWATWCGPCQQPMADLQKLRDEHATWGDKVAIVPLSIDDTIDAVRKHVDKRGWTNTFNVWAGDGGWKSAPATTFRVRGVPTTYIIDPQGAIVVAGHPASMRIGDKVDSVLSEAKN